MKSKLAAIALFCSAALMCSESNADLLGRMLGRGGCGDCQAVSSCCDTPAPACGGRNFGVSININIGHPGRLFRGGGCGGGLLARDTGCGCDSGCAPAVTPIVETSCGCGAVDTCGAVDSCGNGGLLQGNLFGRLRGRLGGMGCGCDAAPADCGCAAPMMETCGPTCDDGCSSGLLEGGLFGRLRGRFSGGCGCDSAPASDCGCAAPATDCGCSAPAPAMTFGDAGCGGCDTGCDSCGGGRIRGRVAGLLSRLKPACGSCGAPAGDCGCGAPVMEAPIASCGCDNAPACGSGRSGRVRGFVGNLGGRLRGTCNGCGSTSCDGGCGGTKLSLLARLRGDRTVRDNCGCNDGCQPACPNSGCMTGCNSCGGGVAMPMPYQGESVIQPAPAYQQGTIVQPMESAPRATPEMAPVPAATTEGAVETPATDGAYRQPIIDPKAFVIRRK